MMLQGVRLRAVPHFPSGIVERAKRERAWKCRLFSRGVIFTRARVSLAVLSLRKNGGLLIVQQGVNVCVSTPLHANLGLKVQYLTKPLILSFCMVFFEIHRREAPDDTSVFSFPKSPRINLNFSTFSPSMPSMSSTTFQETEDLTPRPKTAPIPPTLESPRANPRITSAKPPPPPRGSYLRYTALL